MPPVFKKPQEYNPQAAEQTLRSLKEGEERAQKKKQSMLAELGLADVEIDVVDDAEDEEFDESSPLFSPSPSSSGGAAMQTIDLALGADYYKQRQATIESRGYERFLHELIGRSHQSLQRIKALGGGSFTSSSSTGGGRLSNGGGNGGGAGMVLGADGLVIAQLSHELASLHREVKAVKASHSSLSRDLMQGAEGYGGEGAAVAEGGVEELEELRSKLEVSKLAGQREAARCRELMQQLTKAAEKYALLEKQNQQLKTSSSGGAATAAAPVPTLPTAAVAAATVTTLNSPQLQELEKLKVEIEALRGQFESKDKELQDSRNKIQDLQAQLTSSSANATDTVNAGHAAVNGNLTAAAAAAVVATSAVANVDDRELIALKAAHEKKVKELLLDIEDKEALFEHVQSQNLELSSLVEKLTAELATAKDLTAAAAATSAPLPAPLIDTSAMKAQLLLIQDEIKSLHKVRESILDELVSMKTDIFNEKTLQQMSRMVRDKEISLLRKAKSESKTEVDTMTLKLNELRDELTEVQRRSEETLKIKELESQALIKHYMDKWRSEFDKRKKLHNLVAELKGNIRVLCRVRPFIDKEAKEEGAPDPIKCLTEETLRVISVDAKADRDFEFDRVFAPSDGQEKIFEEVSSLVTSVLDGYNVSIMAYGQTGSGKTFTMEGPDSNPGVNSRALQELFTVAEQRKEDYSYSFQASILEIYNEQIFDLLVASKDQEDKLDIKQAPEGGMHVPGLIVEPVESVAQVAAMIDRGKKNRSTFATNMNEHSSRSHLVFSVYVAATPKSTAVGATSLRGKLHLIDLAGSERLSKTGAQGDRLKEAQNINKSLSALGDVIQALQQREKHIPYRNSKLTRLLEDSLGSSAKCVMVVNVSPAVDNVPETKCSLDFASRARKVELGRAKVNTDAPNNAASTTSSGLTLSRSTLLDGTSASGNRTPISGRSSPAVSRPGSAARGLEGAHGSSGRLSNLGKEGTPPIAPRR